MYFQQVESIVTLCIRKAAHLGCFQPAVTTTPSQQEMSEVRRATEFPLFDTDAMNIDLSKYYWL